MATLAEPSPEKLDALCRRWKIRELRLFGSRARGDARPDSDVDLMVEYEPDPGWSLLDAAQMRIEFAELFGHPVDLVRDVDITNPYRRVSVHRDLRLIYAA